MNTPKDNEHRTVLITGGSRGIGRAVALRLAAAQTDRVILSYLENERAAHETSRMIENSGCECILAPANLLFPEEIDRMFDGIAGKISRIDAFVHCAALTAFKPLLAVKANQWDLTMNVSTRAFVLCVQRAVPMMPPGSSIIAISSLGSHRVLPNYGAMGPAKAALEAAVRYLASELAPRGIHVNAVSGGFVDTDSIRKYPNSEQVLQESIRHTPMGRLAVPEDIAAVVAFLCSPLADWICGQVIVADGGVSTS